MFATLKNALAQKNTRNKLLFTIAILLIYRLGAYIPVPGIPFNSFADAWAENAGAALGVLDLFSGGALSNMSLLSLGIMPYITASIIMTMARSVIPTVEQWSKSGYAGRQKITKWTRWLTLVLGIINAFGYLLLFKGQYGVEFSSAVPSWLSDLMVMFALLLGVAIIMWLGELITQRGIGNGMSVIIFTSVVSSVPSAVYQSIVTSGEGAQGIAYTVLIVVGICIIIPAIVFIERAQRRIPIQQAVSNSARFAGGGTSVKTSYLPIKVNMSGVMGIIFASSLLYFPAMIAAFFPDVEWLTSFSNFISSYPANWILNGILIVVFCFFYTSFVFIPDDIADNLKKSGSIIPGYRPGADTANYLERVSKCITLPGALYVAAVAVITSILFYVTNNNLIQAFGGTSVFIMVSVALDIASRLESQVNDYRDVPSMGENRRVRRRR